MVNTYYLIIELTRLIIIHQAFKNTTIITDKIRIDYYIKIINHRLTITYICIYSKNQSLIAHIYKLRKRLKPIKISC